MCILSGYIGIKCNSCNSLNRSETCRDNDGRTTTPHKKIMAKMGIFCKYLQKYPFSRGDPAKVSLKSLGYEIYF